MQLSGTYLTASGNARAGDVTVTPVNSRDAAQTVTADDDGAWSVEVDAGGQFTVTQEDGWSTTVIAFGDHAGIQRTVDDGQANGSDSAWTYLTKEGDWVDFDSPGGDTRLRAKVENGQVFFEGSASGGVGDPNGSSVLTVLPERFHPDRTAIIFGTSADLTDPDPSNWIYGTCHLAVVIDHPVEEIADGTVFVLEASNPESYVAFMSHWLT